MAISNDDNDNQIVITKMNEPSKPIIVVTIPNSITLTSSNYLSWKTQVEAVLIGYDLYDKYVDGTIPAPCTTITIADGTTLPNPDYQTWLRQDKLIFGALIGTLSSNVFPLVSQAKTTHQLWDILAKTYDNNSIQIRPGHMVHLTDYTSPPLLLLEGAEPASCNHNHKRRRINNLCEEDGQMSEKVDRISKLPDDILVLMLSLVDMKTAGRSSILSKRWRSIWTHLSDLNFDPDLFLSNKIDIDNHADRYITWVNEVISRNCASNLNTLRIRFPLYGSYVADINNWIEFALNKKVRHLELNLSTLHGNNYFGTGYIIRPDFLLIHPVYNDHITTLRSLHLQGLFVDGPVLENVLSYCLNLERLTVKSCSFYSTIFSRRNNPLKQRLVISSLNLKHLDLCYCQNIEFLEIFAPKLASFMLFAGCKKIEVKYTSVPLLVNVTFGGQYCNQLLQNLHLISNLSNQLQKLSIHWHRETTCINPGAPLDYHVEDNFLGLTSFIEACPLLHTFKLELWPSRRQVVPMGAQRDVPSSYALKTHNQLKVLELVGFDGSASVAELAFCLTENAPMLNKIICDPHCPPSIPPNRHKWYDIEYVDRIPYARGQAELLANHIRSGVDVVIL